jgi:hypothetical protein
MSFYRCLFCGAKFEEYSDDDLFEHATEKDVKDSEWNTEGSDYEWVVCSICRKERRSFWRKWLSRRDTI